MSTRPRARKRMLSSIPLLPKVGCAWMPKGPAGGDDPGQNQKHYLAGALELTTGTLHHWLGPRKTNALFRNLLACLDARYPAERYTRLYVVVDNYKSIKPKRWSSGWLPIRG